MEHVGKSIIRYLTDLTLTYLGTGEHGVGVGKKEYLNDELGTGTVELMRRVKDAIDPKHIMNPGKVSQTHPCGYAWLILV